MAKKPTVRAFFVSFVEGANKVAEAQQELQNKRVGTYANMVLAGITAGDADTFTHEVEKFEDEIRSNKRGIAVRLNCEVAKPKKGDDESVQRFKIPSSFMAAKSYVLSSLSHDIDLGTTDEPRAYTAIRKEVDAVNAAEKIANLEGDDKVRHTITEALAGVLDRVSKATGEPLEAIQTETLAYVTKVREAYGIAEMRAQKLAEAAEDTEAEELAEAAAA